MDFLTSLINVAMLVALAIPGFLLQKFKLLPENSVAVINVILLFVAQPFLAISSFLQKEFELRLLANMGLTALFAFVLIMLIYFVSLLVFKFAKEDAAKKAYVLAGCLGNCGFMAIPLMRAFFPDNPEPVMYAAVFVAVFNILTWTLSVFVITGNRKYISIRVALLNPPTVALVVALPLFFLSVKLPAPVMTGIDFLGDLATPLSMIIMGIRVAGMSLKELFGVPKVYLSAFVKLVLSPLISLGVLLLVNLVFPLDPVLVTTLYIIMAVPSAASVIMFSERFGGDGVAASKCVLLSSILSVITIPLIMLLCVFIV